MDIVIWVVSGLLAALYLLVGIGKIRTPKDELAADPRMAWTNDFSASAVKGIGTAEVLGAIGLVVPWLTGIAPVLTPIAAVGLAVIQLGAIITHARRGERQPLPVNAILLVLAAFVAVVRFTQL